MKYYWIKYYMINIWDDVKHIVDEAIDMHPFRAIGIKNDNTRKEMIKDMGKAKAHIANPCRFNFPSYRYVLDDYREITEKEYLLFKEYK